MCLAVPAKIIELLDGQKAKVSVGGVQKVISVSLVDDLEIGDFVLVHVGHALSKVDSEEAQKTLELFAEVFEAEVSSADGYTEGPI